MYYSIRHTTRFNYSAPIFQSVMEIRKQPRSEGAQSLLSFEISMKPGARIMSYTDFLDNTIHHFDIPGHHNQLSIVAESLVEMGSFPDIPESLDGSAWFELDAMVEHGNYWEMLLPSHFAHPTDLLRDLMAEWDVHDWKRRDDPLTVLRRLNTSIHDSFAYVKQSTRVDSPIDDALRNRKGVCQDFTHVMIALVRDLGIPCRYVSGYLFHRTAADDRPSGGATHAWAEALLPRLGWVGFDPTNNRICGERHIRVAIGRDYQDVPPTRGVFKKGTAETRSELTVAVQVRPSEAPPRTPLPDDDIADFEGPPMVLMPSTVWAMPVSDEQSQQPQQQQQR